jgi:hypothetical protein
MVLTTFRVHHFLMEIFPQTGRIGRFFDFGPAASVVLVHAIVTLVHGAAHTGLRLTLSRWDSIFVAGVVVIGPLAGLGLCWSGRRISGWAIVAVTMTLAFGFGLWNHFVSPGPDHVAHLPSAAWRLPFQVTALLLAATEASGAVLGLLCWSSERKASRSGESLARSNVEGQ